MELRIDYSSNIQGQEHLAIKVAELSHELGRICMLMPMLAENVGAYPTMEMFINGDYAFGSDFEIQALLSDGTIEQILKSTNE